MTMPSLPSRSNSSATVTRQDEDDDDEGPSRLMFVLVSGVLGLCISAISTMTHRGKSISSTLGLSFHLMRQELLLLAMTCLLSGYQICIWLALYTRSRLESAKADTTAAIFMQGLVKYGGL